MLRHRFFISLAIIVIGSLFVSCARAPLAPILDRDRVRVIPNITYFEGRTRDSERHRLDIYLPGTGSGWPVAVVVHGGGWMVNDKTVINNLGYALANAGIAAVCCNYRLYPEVTFPENVKDVARAAAWARHFLSGYGSDPDSFFIIGYSAGAQLASLVVLDKQYLNTLGLDPKIFRGAMMVSGIYDVKMLPLPIRMIFTENPANWHDASPINHVRSDAPPFLILNAQHDMALTQSRSVKNQSRIFASALKSTGVSVESYEIPNCNHDQIMEQAGREKNSETLKRLLDFISQHR